MITHNVSVRPNSIFYPDAVKALHQRVKAAVTEPDPAPWMSVPPVHIELYSEGDETAYVRDRKLQERTLLFVQRALLSGSLRAHFSNSLDSCNVPGWAWEGLERNENVWLYGELPLNVFLPDQWHRWSCQKVYLDRDAFAKWMEGQTFDKTDGLPELPPPYDVKSKPETVSKRLPTDKPFVTLSEALTWIAFRFALDCDSLRRAMSGGHFDAPDPQAALADAIAKFADLASAGRIVVRGKYVESHKIDENTVLTAEIDPVRFADYGQFDNLYDGLRFGTGITWRDNQKSTSVLRSAYRRVTVNRAELLRLFPGESVLARALFNPLPAYLPGIGQVIGLEEGLCWLAYNRPSYDSKVWRDDNGNLTFTDPDGNPFPPFEPGKVHQHIQDYRSANRAIVSALRDSDLQAYVVAENAGPLQVPRFYWNGVNPESLPLVFDDADTSVPGVGCPVLLPRQPFDAWRGARSIPPGQSNRSPSVKAGRPPSDEDILAKANEMKARGLDGRAIAKEMRNETGFENVATTAVRELIKGRWKPTGRPRKGA